MAIVSILGALIGAGGSIAGGVLSQPEEPEVFLPPIFDPSSDPLVALNTLDLLASQGVFAPESVLSQAGPLQQAVQAFSGTTPTGGRNRDRGRRDQAIAEFLAGQDTAGADIIARAGGFGSVREAHEAQAQFEAALGPRLNNLREIADLSRRRSLDSNRQLTDLVAALRPLDFESVREGEQARIGRELDERRTEALRSANAAGFNPAGALEAIEELRGDSELDAITRAINVLGGQVQANTGQAALLQALDPANRSQSLAPALLPFRIPRVTASPGVVQPATDPFGAAVASAAQQAGGGLISAAGQQRSDDRFNQLLELERNRNKPAVGPV